ncbi:MAG: DUF4270 family protein [Bacteroidota bacterium]|nr:DUF4270 family protein [Bacteroidota bacterium]
MKRIYLILVVFAILFFSSCVNEDEKLGLSLIDSNNSINILRDNSSGVELSAKMFNTDTILTNNLRYNAMGTYKDNNFGKISSSIFTQLSLSSSGNNFRDLGQADSVVLSLEYAGAFVKDKSVRTMNIHFKVEEVTEEITTDKKRANDNVEVGQTWFDGDVFVDMDNDNIKLDNDTNTYSPHLRLKLNDVVLQKLANGYYEDNSAFQSDFKGIKISATSNDANGMLIYVDMTATLSCLTYYYTSSSNNKYSYKITFPTDGQRFMKVDFDYSGTSLALLDTIPSVVGDNEYIYLSCLGMSEVELNIANFMQWYERDSIKGALINKAELVLPVADVSGNSFTYPSSLQCYRKDAEGNIYLLRDENIASSINAVPYYDSTINAYRVQLTSYLQNYVRGSYGDDATIYIIPSMRDRNNSDNGFIRRNTANRVVLNGTNYSDINKRPKLNITYSTIADN